MTEARYAVLIGSSDFPDERKLLPSLRCPVRDVEGFARILKSERYGGFTETIALKNRPSHEILPIINKVLKRAQKNDLVLIYYSGHGKLNPTGALHLATFNTQIETLESTSIPVSNIRNYIDASPTNRLVLILDCCYSGSVGDAFLKGSVDDQLQQASGGSSGRGIYILTASTATQVAQEKEHDEYSLLTKYLLEGIREGKADFDDDGQVSIGDLYKFAYDEMSRESFQVPMKWDLSVRGESPVLARTGKAQGARRAEQIEGLLFRRRRFRDRYIIGGLTVGGAFGAAVGVTSMRLPIAVAMLGSDELIPTRLFNFFYCGAILGGALTLGIALAGQFWKTTEASDQQPASWSYVIRKFGNRSKLAIFLGTLLFAVAYLLVSILGGMQLALRQSISTLVIGLVIGLGLSLALYNQPKAGMHLGMHWLWRLTAGGLTLLMAQLPSIFGWQAPLPVITWETAFYGRQFAGSESAWAQTVLDHPRWLQYFGALDAFLVGVFLVLGITIGLTKAADALAKWVALVQPDRE
jgi:hypothetical protein